MSDPKLRIENAIAATAAASSLPVQTEVGFETSSGPEFLHRGTNAMATLASEESVAPISPDANGWLPIETAVVASTPRLGWVDGRARIINYGKTSHVPIYGWILIDQGAEDCELCRPSHWQPLPKPPAAALSQSPHSLPSEDR